MDSNIEKNVATKSNRLVKKKKSKRKKNKKHLNNNGSATTTMITSITKQHDKPSPRCSPSKACPSPPSCDSPSTPKPLDYRSESKRNATPSGSSLDPSKRMAKQGNPLKKNNSDAATKKTEQINCDKLPLPSSSGSKTSLVIGAESANRKDSLFQMPSSSSLHNTAGQSSSIQDGQAPHFSNWQQQYSNYYKPWTGNIPPFYQDVSLSPHQDNSGVKKWWQEKNMFNYLDGSDNWMRSAVNDSSASCWPYSGPFMSSQIANAQEEYFGSNSATNASGHNLYHPFHRSSYSSNVSNYRYHKNVFKPGKSHVYHEGQNYPSSKSDYRFDSGRSPFMSYRNKSGHRQHQHMIPPKNRRYPRPSVLSSIAKRVKTRSRPQSAGAILVDSTVSRLSKLSIQKKAAATEATKDVPEDPKKKALAAAASKLRKSFLMSKKGSTTEEDSNFLVQENAEDLSMNHSGKTATEDASFQITAEESNSGSNFSGSSNNEDRSTSPNANEEHCSTSFDLQDISEEEEEDYFDNEEQSSSSILPRRRHMSETAGAACPKFTAPSRSRSNSTSGVGSLTSPIKNTHYLQPRIKNIQPRIDKMLVKQLLTLDKKSLKVSLFLHILLLLTG